jgi:macrocin-O-methyltransferase TylF-like protien
MPRASAGRLPGIARALWAGRPFVAALSGLANVVPPHRLPALAWRFARVERFVPCPHSIDELTEISRAVAARRGLSGSVVECGCFKGGSTARVSLICKELNRRLFVFDSFEGLPEPEEWDAIHAIARPRRFRRGEYHGALGEVQTNIARYGALGVCEFVPGWFNETMAEATPPEVAVAFIDADLVASTRDALEHVWPRLVERGVVFVHDATDAKLAEYLDTWSRSVRPARASRLPASLAWFEK